MRRNFVGLAIALTACLPAEVREVRATRLDDDGLTFIRGGGGNSVVLVRGGRALVFDPKVWPFDREVVRVLREAGATAEIVVDSHLHFDHTGGNSAHPGARIFAAPYALAELADSFVGARAPRPAGVPTVPVLSKLVVTIGGEPVELVNAGPAHTGGDVFAWFPRRKVLATGDLFDNGFYPHIDPAHGGTFVGYLAAVEKLCAYDAEIVIPGHGDRATRRELELHRDFLRTIRNNVANELAAGVGADAIVAKLAPRETEQLQDLGAFSSRRGVVEAFVSELAKRPM